MSKHKLISIIAGVAIISGVFMGATTLENKSSSNKIVTNKILLASPQSNKGIVVNGGKSPLVIYNNTETDSSIANYVSNGETVTVEGTKGEFYKVKVEQTGDTGYIAQSNVELVTSAVNQKFEKVKIKKGNMEVSSNIPNLINMKSEPTPNSKTVGTITNFMAIHILGEQGNWYKISNGDIVGYVNKEYVEIIQPLTGHIEAVVDGYKIIKGNVSRVAQCKIIEQGTWAPRIYK